VVVGASEIAGKPIALCAGRADGDGNDLPHREPATSPAHTRNADILVVAVGKAGLITDAHVKEEAIVIDVGINRIKQRMAR
jgi:methylenetetrahydrofolate dehydrogenase (NADP+)/methenyltetrahydrofolate cyclohydrolase